MAPAREVNDPRVILPKGEYPDGQVTSAIADGRSYDNSRIVGQGKRTKRRLKDDEGVSTALTYRIVWSRNSSAHGRFRTGLIGDGMRLCSVYRNHTIREGATNHQSPVTLSLALGIVLSSLDYYQSADQPTPISFYGSP